MWEDRRSSSLSVHECKHLQIVRSFQIHQSTPVYIQRYNITLIVYGYYLFIDHKQSIRCKLSLYVSQRQSVETSHLGWEVSVSLKLLEEGG